MDVNILAVGYAEHFAQAESRVYQDHVQVLSLSVSLSAVKGAAVQNVALSAAQSVVVQNVALGAVRGVGRSAGQSESVDSHVD